MSAPGVPQKILISVFPRYDLSPSVHNGERRENFVKFSIGSN